MANIIVFLFVLVSLQYTNSQPDLVSDTLDNTKDALQNAGDLTLEPVLDTAKDVADSVKDATDNVIEKVVDIREGLLNPYKKVMEMFKIDKVEDFTEGVLEKMVDKYVGRFHCSMGLVKRSLMCPSALVSIFFFFFFVVGVGTLL